MRRCVFLLGVLPAALASAQPADAPFLRTRGYVAAEPRLFPQDARFPQQGRLQGSLAAEVELRHEWGGRNSLVLTPFLRVDGTDSRRSHADVREAAVRVVTDHFELEAGVAKVFWGVTESQHLVDVINQTDLVENPDGEDKLGQPMLHLTVPRRWGTFEIFVLPLARPRTFPGAEGRLRPALLVDGEASTFEGGRWRPSVAARWSKSLGLFDVGLSHFYGTSREPRLTLAPGGDGTRLMPHYDLVHQTGLEAQWTAGRWLWKLEGIRRTGPTPSYFAATAGFEYALANAFGLGFDLGLIGEYLHDERGSAASTPWQDDVFAGVRVAPNDAQGTELLAGVIVDRRSRATAWSLEASRRIGGHWRVGFEARAFRAFRASRADDPLAEMRRDGYVQTELSYRF
jgi:hypothetical protein